MTFCLCRRTYSGHLTKRVKSFLGAMSPPGSQRILSQEEETDTHRCRRSWASSRREGSVPPSWWSWCRLISATTLKTNIDRMDVEEKHSHGAEAGLERPLAALGCKVIELAMAPYHLVLRGCCGSGITSNSIPLVFRTTKFT